MCYLLVLHRVAILPQMSRKKVSIFPGHGKSLKTEWGLERFFGILCKRVLKVIEFLYFIIIVTGQASLEYFGKGTGKSLKSF